MSAGLWNRSGHSVRLMPIQRFARGRGWFGVDGAFVIVPIVAAFEGALAWVAVSRLGVRVHSARGVLKRLDESNCRWSVDTGRFTQTWNPAGDEAGGRVAGKGRATYWIDDSGLIHLLFEPVEGPARTIVGPRPAPAHHGQARAVIALSIVVALWALAVGGTLGYLAGGVDDRFNPTMFGALVGLFVAWVDWPVIAGLAFRRTRAARS